MTHSLFLAQQNANYRLEELKDQAVNDIIASEDSTHLTEPLFPSLTPVLSTGTITRPTGNRLSTIIDAIIYDSSPTFTPANQKRTSVLLNKYVLETNRPPQ